MQLLYKFFSTYPIQEHSITWETIQTVIKRKIESFVRYETRLKSEFKIDSSWSNCTKNFFFFFKLWYYVATRTARRDFREYDTMAAFTTFSLGLSVEERMNYAWFILSVQDTKRYENDFDKYQIIQIIISKLHIWIFSTLIHYYKWYDLINIINGKILGQII